MEGGRKRASSGGIPAVLALIRDSFFYRLSAAVGGAIYRGAMNSWLVRWLSKATVLPGDGLFHELFLGKPAALCKRLRLGLAEQVENSLLVRLWTGFVRHLLALDMVSWGGGLLAFGVTLLGVTGLRALQGEIESFYGVQAAFAAASVLGGFLCATCREPLGEMLLDSGVLRWLLVDFVGVRKSSLSVGRAEHSLFVPVAAGILLGLLTLRLRILYLFLGVAAVVGAALILCVPETGLVLILLALPFLPTMLLTAACLYVDMAFFFKLLRCKRVLRLEAVDLGVAAFGVVQLLLGGLTSLRPAQSVRQVAVYGVFMLTYFMAANSVRSRQMAQKTVLALMLSCFAASMLGVYQNFAGVESTASWIDSEMFAEIGARVVGPFDNPNVFGEYLIMLLPLAISLILARRGAQRLIGAAVTLAAGAALVYTWSRGAWLGAMASVGLLLVLYHAVLLRLVVPAIVALPFVAAALPSAILSRLTSIGNLADTSTAYRVSIWTASVNMLKDIFRSGIGTGSAAFSAVYPAYALGGAAYALHAHNLYLQIFVELGVVGIAVFVLMLFFFFRSVFSCYRTLDDRAQATTILAMGLGVFALLVQGLTDNVWYNYRIVLLFWLLMGLVIGMGRDDGLSDARRRREEPHESA